MSYRTFLDTNYLQNRVTSTENCNNLPKNLLKGNNINKNFTL